MRLLYLGDTSSPHLRAWPTFFARRGHEVHTFHIGFDDPVRIPGVITHPTPFTMRLRIRAAWRLGAAHVYGLSRRIRPDLIHSHEILPPGYTAAVPRLRPHVATAWGSEVLLARPWQARAIRRVVTSADLVTADSQHLLRVLASHGAPDSRLRFVPWGVEPDWVAIGARVSKEEATSSLDLPSHRPIVLAHRGIRSVYRPDTVVRALGIVASHAPEALGVVLFHPTTAHEFLPPLRALVAELRIEQQVRFLPLLPHVQMPLLFRAADVCVSVAESDSAPTSVFEALALGRPVIVSDLPWVHEPIHREAELAVVPVGDHRLLADAISQSLARTDLAAIEKNRRLIEEHFNRDEIFDNVGTEYERIVDEHRGAIPAW